MVCDDSDNDGIDNMMMMIMMMMMIIMMVPLLMLGMLKRAMSSSCGPLGMSTDIRSHLCHTEIIEDSWSVITVMMI